MKMLDSYHWARKIWPLNATLIAVMFGAALLYACSGEDDDTQFDDFNALQGDFALGYLAISEINPDDTPRTISAHGMFLDDANEFEVPSFCTESLNAS